MKICPRCETKLRRMITKHPHIDHELIEAYECPECGYDSFYDADDPIDVEDEDQKILY